MDTVGTPCVVPQHSLLGGAENMKLLFDSVLQNVQASATDNTKNARGWDALSLRMANNAATVDHAINAGLVLAGQIGVSEGQQVVSPAGTAASETTKGAVAAAGAGEAVSAEAVTANVANLFTATIPVITSALATAVSQTLAAILPVVITAAGGASTPSQTQAKPGA